MGSIEEKKRKKILFILPTLTPGGAERIISFIAQNIDPEKFDSTLLVVSGFKKEAAYKINNINVVFFEKKRVLNAVPNIFWYLLKNNPNVVLSSISHINTVMGLMAPIFIKTKFIIREASVVSQYNNFGSKHKNANKLHSLLPHISYKLVNAIVCQSNDMAIDFINVFKIDHRKIIIINNPITNNYPLEKKTQYKNEVTKFITVGRLSNEKGHLRIIKMLSQVRFEFHYTIIGDGPLKNEIFESISNFSLNDRITYIPFTNNVNKYLAESDLFLQGSYVEGFPNALLESCMAGTPAIAFNVPGGTKEIIENGINGYIVDSESEYLDVLHKNIQWLPENIRNSVYKKFNKEKILKEYEKMFLEL